MNTVATIGEILVEIMATRRGQSFAEPGPLIGPYASGAPAIFIDQVARLGQPCGIIGCVGDDDFGRLSMARLRRDGVDVSAIKVHRDAPTGTAFVAYDENGGRHFVFNIKHSASGSVTIDPAAERLLDRADHLHVMGSSLFSPDLVTATETAVKRIKQRGGTVSFDPNVRNELARGSELAATFDFLLDQSDVVLPSGVELFAVASHSDEPSAIAALLARGIDAVVVKRGDEGASYHGSNGSLHAAAWPVEEVDPTGAGDCFDATFIVCRLRGMDIAASLHYANAAGARVVMTRGPMEGVSSFADLEQFLEERSPT